MVNSVELDQKPNSAVSDLCLKSHVLWRLNWIYTVRPDLTVAILYVKMLNTLNSGSEDEIFYRCYM